MTDTPDTIAPLFVVFVLITSHDCQNGFACISPLQRFIAPSKDLKKAFFYLSVSPARKDFFRKPTRPSLPLRKAPPLISVFSPQGRRRKPPSGARNRCAIWLADHQRSSPYCAGWDRWAVMGISLQLYC